MKERIVKLGDVLKVLEGLEKKCDRENDPRGYIALMEAADAVQKIPESEGDA